MKKILVAGSILVVLGLLIVGIAVPALARNPSAGEVTAASGVYLDQPTLVRLAQALDLTPDGLTGRLQAGETLSAIAKTQKVATEEVVGVLIAPYASELDLRVQYGYITRPEADGLLEKAREHASVLLEQDLSVSDRNANCTQEEMEEYCDSMMDGNMMDGNMMGSSMMGGSMMGGSMMGGNMMGGNMMGGNMMGGNMMGGNMMGGNMMGGR